MENTSQEKTNPYKIPFFVAALGLFSSIFVAFYNGQNNRDLEEKKMEINLIVAAIKNGNKEETKKNLQFLIQSGLVSPERGQILENLTRSYSKPSIQNLTKNDTAVFYDFQINIKERLIEKLRGNFLISFICEDDPKLSFSGFTDNQGKISFSFPKNVCGKNFEIKIEKIGYLTQKYNYTFPPKKEDAIVYKQIFMIKR